MRLIRNNDLKNPNPEFPIEIVCRHLRGETVKEFGGNIKIALQVAEIAVEKSGDYKYREKLAKLNELVRKKLAGETIELKEINSPNTSKVPEGTKILETDKTVTGIEERIKVAEILLTAEPEVMEDSRKMGKREIETIKKLIEQAELNGIYAEKQKKMLSDLIAKCLNTLKFI